MSEIQNPHDQFVRSVFAEKEIAVSFLENYLPPKVAEKFDLTTLETTSESFIDKDLQAYHTDLLFRLRLKNNETAFVYVLLEHKSFPEKFVAFQIFRYLTRIYEKFHTENPNEKFPLVVPIVLYHGKRRWKISRQFADLVKDGNNTDCADFVPKFEYFLCDLSAFDADKLKGIAALRLAMSLLKYIFRPELTEKLVEIFAILREMPDKGVIEFWSRVLRYLFSANPNLKKGEVEKAMETALKTKKSRGEKRYEEFIEEFTQRFRTEGLREGKQEGLREGSAIIILNLLTKRFGKISANRKAQISELTMTQLEKLSGDLLDFQTLADFEAWLLQNSN